MTTVFTYRQQKREAQARWRASAKAAHGRLKRYEKSLFDRGRFVAVDGEGFADGDAVAVKIGPKQKNIEGRDHFYGLLMDSDGESLSVKNGRLSTKKCLDFLLSINQRDKNAIPVIFGGSYDACHMLAFGLDRDEVQTLLKSDNIPGERRYLDKSLSENGTDNDYRLEYRPRKSLTIWRFASGADKYIARHKRDGTKVWKLNYEARVVLWDVWGFFQGSFIRAMENWIPDDPDWHFIRDMKGSRSQFRRDEIDMIRRYTAAELRCLVAMMERVRDSIRKLDLKITRWDGAGAIAGAFFKKHDVKTHMGETPEDVFHAARTAYSGGHIEATVIGHHTGKIFHADINSAYPHQFRRLPGLAYGRWHHGECGEPPGGFTLVRLEFHFEPGRPFYPLFWRAGNGSILYPERGSGWYWYDEYAVAREFADRFGAFVFRVAEWHHFEPAGNQRPFAWIEEAYQVRRDVIMTSRRTGIRDDSHMMIRLGLNSCYGKTAQQVGARHVDGAVQPPSYFQLEWAGAVTAGCRAQLMSAALQAPDAVISFATDAIFATEPLDLPADPAKRLGEWEVHQHSGMTIVMPGVYWLHEDGGKLTHFSRGFDKETMSDCQFVHDAWKRRETFLKVKQHRMVSPGAAMMSESMWKLRGLFVTTERELKINGQNSKRHPVAMTQVRPWRELCRTQPRDHTEDYGQDLDSLMSAPYPVKWLDQPREDEWSGDMESAFLADNDAFESAFLA